MVVVALEVEEVAATLEVDVELVEVVTGDPGNAGMDRPLAGSGGDGGRMARGGATASRSAGNNSLDGTACSCLKPLRSVEAVMPDAAAISVGQLAVSKRARERQRDAATIDEPFSKRESPTASHTSLMLTAATVLGRLPVRYGHTRADTSSTYRMFLYERRSWSQMRGIKSLASTASVRGWSSTFWMRVQFLRSCLTSTPVSDANSIEQQ